VSFSFFHLEVTTLATLSLILLGICDSAIRDSAFFQIADEVLEDMARKGNTLSTLFRKDLATIHRLAVNTCPRGEEYAIRHIGTFSLVRDGPSLDKAIVEVMEPNSLNPHANPSSLDTSQSTRMGYDTTFNSIGHTGNTHGPQIYGTADPDGLVLPSDGASNPFLAMDEDFDFDIVDLQWLDSVQ
jgi:hypothetical protein